VALALAFGRSAEAQTIGVRAAGLAGAFVAVADDATSVYWNPAGMATGAFMSFVVDFGRDEASSDESSTAGAMADGTGSIALTLPPLGVSYYRLERRVAGPPQTADSGASGREEGWRSVQGLTTDNVGVSLAQSLGDYVVVAGTFRLVHGELAAGTTSGGSAEDALDAVDRQPHRSTTRGDIDAGVMVEVDRFRIGVVARNLTRPTFDGPHPSAASVTLAREARAGAAWGSAWPLPSRVMVSADLDLTRRADPFEDRQDVAAGVETWWWQQRLAFRGGVRGSLVGAVRPVVAGGVSVAARRGVFIDAHGSAGTLDERSWSLGVRMTF
jgi:hypothetical protein